VKGELGEYREELEEVGCEADEDDRASVVSKVENAQPVEESLEQDWVHDLDRREEPCNRE